MKKHNCMPFYEYYFEPSGKNGMVVIQFMHKDFDKGMKAKKHFESMINMAQYAFLFLFLILCFSRLTPSVMPCKPYRQLMQSKCRF